MRDLTTQLQLGKQRVLMAEMVIRIMENLRDQNLPKTSLWDFLPAMIIVLKMFEDCECDANVSGLSRSTGKSTLLPCRRLESLPAVNP
jgi:hypothetical protein